MNGNRGVRVAATGARLLTGAVVAAACVVGTVVAITAPWPTITHAAAHADVAPQPGDAVLACNGDLRALGRDSANPLQMDSAAAARFTDARASGKPDVSDLSVTDLTGAGPLRRVSGAAEGRTAPLIGAAESVDIKVDDLAGFAAAPCRVASSESWLVGGSVATGTKDLIILTNPWAVPSTVSLSVYGSTRSSSSSIVPAGSQVAIPLSSIASGSDAPVVKVSAAGAPVRATLQSSFTQTLDPVGIDLQDSVTAAQQHPVIPGVELFPDESDDSAAGILRLLSPGADTTAHVTVRAMGQSAVASTFDVALTADVPAEVGLSNLDPGTYSVYIDAGSAVVSGVRIQDGVAPGSDFAWLMPAPDLAERVLVAVPSGPATTISFVNDGTTDATVDLESVSQGQKQTITVPAGSSASADVNAGAVYSLDPSGSIHASVMMAAKGTLAGWPVWPGAGTAQSIVVYP